MSENPFAPPAAAGEGIKWADHLGHLLYIEPLSVETGISTVHGPTDAVRANVTVIQGPAEVADYPDTLVFPKVLQGQLRGQVGKKVLGRLTQGQAKPGQSAPWMLQEASPEDVEIGKRWLAKIAGDQPAAAAPAVSTPF